VLLGPRRRWREVAEDPGAALERVIDALPRLAGLSLPGEWAIGWAIDEEFPAADAPLARLLLHCAGRAGAPAITLMFPSYKDEPDNGASPHYDDHVTDYDDGYNMYDQYVEPDGKAAFARAERRVERVCAAAERQAAGRAGEGGGGRGGGGGGQPGGAGLPHVGFGFDDRLEWEWAHKDEASDEASD
jgi:hypothetical protein